jgi:3-oxoacyl-[acyl-carrier protein] reductase
MNRLTSKNAVVLGASAEGGTGWTIAQQLAQRDIRVIAGARRGEGIKKLCSQINGVAIQCDATIEAQVEALSNEAVYRSGGKLDIAILVAGEGVMGNIGDISEASLQHALALNFFAPVYFVRHMARQMNNGGSIVLMSSVAANRPWPGYFAYGCAKAALQTLVQYAALEYAPRGIRVNAVCPGPIQTPDSLKFLSVPAVRDCLAHEIPLGRTVLPEEVAEAVLWFATQAPGTTGECMSVDGGMHLRRPPFPDELAAAMKPA